MLLLHRSAPPRLRLARDAAGAGLLQLSDKQAACVGCFRTTGSIFFLRAPPAGGVKRPCRRGESNKILITQEQK